MSKSTAKRANGKADAKPQKPRPDFPLFPHASNRWAKKVRGKFWHFGKVSDDPKGVAALDLWLEQKDALLAGRTPRVSRDGLTIEELLDRFLTSKIRLRDNGEITSRTFDDYEATCTRIVGAFGKHRPVDDLAADDFEHLRAELAKKRGPMALGNEIQRIRVAFKYGYDAGLIDKPVRYGPAFKRPSKTVLRKARNEKGARMFEAAQIQQMLSAEAPPKIKAASPRSAKLLPSGRRRRNRPMPAWFSLPSTATRGPTRRLRAQLATRRPSGSKHSTFTEPAWASTACATHSRRSPATRPTKWPPIASWATSIRAWRRTTGIASTTSGCKKSPTTFASGCSRNQKRK